ncbi:MAG TPA: hypothetical protein VI365_21960, partial [Trebonia sp.]
QLGRFSSEMQASSPCSRLGRIVTAAQEGKRWSSEASFADIAHSWDEVIETDSIGGLRAASSDYQHFAAQAPGHYGLFKMSRGQYAACLPCVINAGTATVPRVGGLADGL